MTAVHLLGFVDEWLGSLKHAGIGGEGLYAREACELTSHLVEDALTAAGRVEHFGSKAVDGDVDLDLSVLEVFGCIDGGPALGMAIACHLSLSPTGEEDNVLCACTERHVSEARERCAR